MKKFLTLLATFALGTCVWAQTDATYKIENPSFEVNAGAGWTIVDMVPQSNTSFPLKDGKIYMEKWVGTGNSVGNASMKQTVKNLPKGKYKLTAACQNIQQNNSTAQTGAYIYAKATTNKVVVTEAKIYEIEFTATAANTTIGFVANNATGNYLCCDNFHLTFLSTDAEQLASLIADSKTQQESKMNDVTSSKLASALNALETAIADNTEDLTALALKLSDEYAAAQANTKAYTSLKNLINKAKLATGKKMSNICETALNKALADAELAMETTDNDPVALTAALQTAYDNATASTKSYTNLANAITTAETYIDASLKGADDYEAVVNAAKNMYEESEANDEDIAKQISDLTKAQFAFRLANATPGEGAAPKVTETNHFVPTGANEALMRATFAGDNILEKGVCWSTEHNPTVLNNRTTKSMTLNGTIIHVKGLEHSTVYYLRPYVINKTYTVAYGDEVKIVTHLKGNCVGTWDEGAPTDEANTRCRNAINQTIEYFNQWTGIMGFTLSGHYGSGTPTADCSYGGWMRIGPNASYQAIGTVLHETGHGVGVGTSSRYSDKNVHDWKWFGREANAIYSFLENKEANPYNSDFCMVGDGTHAWGSSASYDWFVNGADKDKHVELQYIGGCCLLYGMFIDGLNPTSRCTNGIAGYTYNFDDAKRYYIMCKDANRGLGEGILYQDGSTNVYWNSRLGTSEPITDDAAWYMEYDPATGNYMFKNAESGKYLTHTDTSISLKTIASGKTPGATEKFQLMPDRTDVTIGTGSDAVTTHGYWICWGNGSTPKSMISNAYSSSLGYGKLTAGNFDYKDTATTQQFIIISEDELEDFHSKAVESGISTIHLNDTTTTGAKTVTGIYSIDGAMMNTTHKGVNIIRYSDGSSKKIYVK